MRLMILLISSLLAMPAMASYCPEPDIDSFRHTCADMVRNNCGEVINEIQQVSVVGDDNSYNWACFGRCSNGAGGSGFYGVTLVEYCNNKNYIHPGHTYPSCTCYCTPPCHVVASEPIEISDGLYKD